MQTNQLVYASTASNYMNYDEISELAQKAAQNNEARASLCILRASPRRARSRGGAP